MTGSTLNIKDLLPNPESRVQTLALIHEAYGIATRNEKDLPQIASSFYDELVKIKDSIPSTDKDFYFKYMAGVKTCYQERERTFEITNLITYINILVCYIICWLNTTPKVVLDSLSEESHIEEFNLDARIISRRKALESELKKILRKALKNDHIMRNREYYSYSPELSCTIRDRFGFLCILRPSLGTSIAPIIYATSFASGVVARLKTNASTTANSRHNNSLVDMIYSSHNPHYTTKPTFLYTFFIVRSAMRVAFIAPSV